MKAYFLNFHTEFLAGELNTFLSDLKKGGVSMTSLPNYQESRVNGNGLAGKLNTAKLFNQKVHGFWEEILDKPVDSLIGNELSSSENAVELNGSLRHIQPLRPFRVSDRAQSEVLAPAAGNTNSTQPLDLFQVGLELLQERLALN